MLFPVIPVDFAALTADELAAFITANDAAIASVSADPVSFVTAEYDSETLLADMTAAVEAAEAAQAAVAALTAETAPVEELGEEFAADITALADRARAAATTAEVEEPAEAAEPAAEATEPEEGPEEIVAAAEPVVAPAPVPAPAVALARPARSPDSAPTSAPAINEIALTAAAGGLGADLGDEIDLMTAAKMMVKRRSQFGSIPKGTSGEKYPIARADWTDGYPKERQLGGDELENMSLVAAVTNPVTVKAELDRRKRQAEETPSLVASGGLCAPVTPYYGLQLLATATRPVRAALPGFGADRGGLRFARPAGLSAITTAIGAITAEADGAGGTMATKSCQRIDCPEFLEVDVDTIYHCLTVGNLPARTFPELVAQWNGLTMAAHARLAESRLLTTIDENCTQVTAGSLGLGASASIFSQYLAAANGLRNRERMNADAVLRLLLPSWSVDLIISDVIRTQFERFDTDAAKVMALFRQFNIEPQFYIDGAFGRGQVFGAQADGALLPFPESVVGYLYVEGSFLYLDGGILELGLVRDSVLNLTNDYQLFGETFENVAFIGIEALAIESEICDSGAVTAPATAPACPIDYTPAT